MKAQGYVLSALLLTAFASASAHAGVSKMAGTWKGNGVVYSLKGQKQGDYRVELVDTLRSDGSVASNVTVTIPGAPDKHFHQILKDTPEGFSMISDQGSGGAVCLGDGLCEGYFGDRHGNGVAITFIFDSSNRVRLLKTELRNFQAVQFYRESYVRAQSN